MLLDSSIMAAVHSCFSVLQGILSPADAQRAADAGVDGVIVSNHGGRQVDFAPAAIEMLPAVAQALRGRDIPILMDGGIRRGTDIIKVLQISLQALKHFVTKNDHLRGSWSVNQ